MVGPPSSKEILVAKRPTTQRAQSGDSGSATGCLVRMGWFSGGNLLLVVLAVLIARAQRWTLSTKDVLFWLALGAVVALRYVDWSRFSPTKLDGERATPRDLRRYSAWLVGTWSALWVLVQTLELG